MSNKTKNSDVQDKDNSKNNIINTNTEEFNKNKELLKKFSKYELGNIELPTVPTSSWCIFDYSVTGEQMNKLTSIIQQKIIDQNEIQIKIIKEFNTIYDTFASLDKGYIQAILISLKAAEEANSKALRGLEGVEKNNSEIVKDQKDIKGLIENNNIVLQVLKKFKEKIDKIDHIKDIDNLFRDFYANQEYTKQIASTFSNSITKQTRINENLKLELNNNTEKLSKIDKINHIKDIDNLFRDFYANQEYTKQIASTFSNSITKQTRINENLKLELNDNADKLSKTDEKLAYFEVSSNKNHAELSVSLNQNSAKFKTKFDELEKTVQKLNAVLNITRILSILGIAGLIFLSILVINGVL